MARVNGPLMSFNASGQVGKAIVFSNWKGRAYVREYSIPSNPSTDNQQHIRHAVYLLSKKWSSLASSQKTALNEAASSLQMSGISLMMKRGLDAYITQLTVDVMPVSVSIAGDYPADTYTWADA